MNEAAKTLAEEIWAAFNEEPTSNVPAVADEQGPNEFVAFVQVGSGGNGTAGFGTTEAAAWADLLKALLEHPMTEEHAARARALITELTGGVQ